jgi:predicted alpha/beta superfamily hydrolase
MKRNLSTLWTSHLQGQKDKDQFKEYILNSSSLWERLNTILENKLTKNKETDYNNAAWAYFQADQNGYNRALKEIQEILPLTNK